MAAQKVVVDGSNVTASQLKDLFRQIEDGSLDKMDLQAFLEHRNPWPIIDEVTIGVYKTAQAYHDALKRIGSECGYIHPESIPLAQEPKKIRLAYVSAADLGFTEEDCHYKRYTALFIVAERKGYKLLPAEAGLALRLACRNVKDGEWVGIAMKPVASKDGFEGNRYIYDVGGREEDGYRFPLCAFDVHRDRIDYDKKFVFEAA